MQNTKENQATIGNLIDELIDSVIDDNTHDNWANAIAHAEALIRLSGGEI